MGILIEDGLTRLKRERDVVNAKYIIAVEEQKMYSAMLNGIKKGPSATQTEKDQEQIIEVKSRKAENEMRAFAKQLTDLDCKIATAKSNNNSLSF